MNAPPLLAVTDLNVDYPLNPGGWRRKGGVLHAVQGVTFEVQPGETVGLVGESGCGKTTLGRAIIRLVEPRSGQVLFDNEDLLALTPLELRKRRRNFQMVFQDPYGSLDPHFTIRQILAEPLEIHALAKTRTLQEQRIAELLKAVGLDPTLAGRRAHELSGGQRQRIGIARALAVEPRFIVCDEPVSALDVSVQAQIVNLLGEIQEERKITLLFIAHDLAVVEHISKKILVMYLGRVVEAGPASEVCRAPRHPYTQALISAIPIVKPRFARPVFPAIKGETASPLHPPGGCPFHPRCPLAQPICREQIPALRPSTPAHSVACHLA